jgi:hypothetical protein
MDLYAHHRRLLIGLHWVAVNTAGCGTFMALFDGCIFLCCDYDAVNSLHHLPPEFVTLACVILAIACVAAVCITQQLILDRAGFPVWWVAATLAGIVIGMLVGLFCGVAAAAICEAMQIFGMEAIVGSGFVFVIGATTAFIQSVNVSTPWYKRLAWMFASGLVVCLMMNLSFAGFFEKYNFTRTGMFAGLLYGLLSGTCLAWMAPSAKDVAAERKYFVWLSKRQFPRKIDWAFLS